MISKQFLGVTTVCFSALLATAGCGSDDSGVVVLVDANGLGVPDAGAEVDAPPLECSAPEMLCSDACVDTTSDELNCGACAEACTGGTACIASECACPEGFLTANPGLVQAQMQAFGGMQLGIGGMFGATLNALVVGFPDTLVATLAEDEAYPLNGTLSGPFAAAGYDLNTQFIPSAAYFGTAGTVTFTRICRDEANAVIGFAGRLDNARFSAVEGLFNPELVDGGCSFTAPVDGGTTVSFDYNCPED